MRVLMLGWEFPPKISGGLGTACQGLTAAMSRQATEVVFLLPGPQAMPTTASIPPTGGAPVQPHPWDSLPGPQAFTASVGPLPYTEPAAHIAEPLPHITFHTVPARLRDPYARSLAWPGTAAGHTATGRGSRQPIGFLCPASAAGTTAALSDPSAADMPGQDYAGDLLAEVDRYAQTCLDRSTQEAFDVIHAHDWMTFPAGMAIAAASGRPLIVHIHSTEWDRCGEQGHPAIDAIERRGIAMATRVIAVSQRTRQLLIDRYQASPDRVTVVYNGVDRPHRAATHAPKLDRQAPCSEALANSERAAARDRQEPIVLFLGRITAQKGPAYFVDAARQVLEKVPEARFIMAGTGDQAADIVELAARTGIGHRLHFTGFLNRQEVMTLLQRAAVFVMPSVAEPFGIAPLEAVSHDVPVIVSRTAGVSEVLRHALKVDFWDTRDIANKIVSVLRRQPLANMLRCEADREVRDLTWDRAAERCREIYQQTAEPLAV